MLDAKNEESGSRPKTFDANYMHITQPFSVTPPPVKVVEKIHRVLLVQSSKGFIEYSKCRYVLLSVSENILLPLLLLSAFVSLSCGVRFPRMLAPLFLIKCVIVVQPSHLQVLYQANALVVTFREH